MKFFIIHGAYGNPEENWFSWLKEKLEKLGQEVIVPKFPTPENQNLNNWIEVFNPYLDKVDKDTVFVGHSLAPAFILSILEKINVQVKACFFVAGFTGLLNNEEFDSINKTFTTKKFNWGKIGINCNKFHIYHSDNDPYVPLVKGQELAKKLSSELIVIKGAGHFNETSEYNEFTRLFIDIIKDIASSFPLIKDDARGKIFDAGKTKFIMRVKGSVSGQHSHQSDVPGKNPEVLELIDGKVEAIIGNKKSIIEAPKKFEIYPETYHEFKALTDIILIEFKEEE